jgi:succinoglycan biosynthesis transport protein ExoP
VEFWTYYRVLRKRYRTVLAAVFVALVVGTIFVWPRHSEYQATVTLTTSPPDEGRYLMLLTDRAQSRPPSTTALAMELIQSRTVAERVVGRLNLKMNAPQLMSRMNLTRPSPELLWLTVTDDNPAAAVLLANTYAEMAVAYNQEVNRRQASLARQYIEQQLQDTDVRLRESENALDELKRQHGIIAMDTQVNSAVGRFLELVNRKDTAEFTERELTARINDIRQRLRQYSPTKTDMQFAENPIAQKLKSDMVGLEVQRAIAESQYTPQHPTVIALKQKIKVLKDTLAGELEKIIAAEFVQVNPLYETLLRQLIDLETQRVAAQATSAALGAIIPQEQKKLPGIADLQREYTRLNRDVQILESTYINLQNRANDFRIMEQAAIDRNLVYIVDPAAAAQPTRTSRILYRILLAGILGLFAGVGLTLFQYQIDDTIKTAKDAERLLGVPVLGSIPKHNPPFDEAYRVLKTTLGLHAANGGVKALMFTSPKPGSGTSTVVYHLAQSLARGGKRVIVVDADLRRPAASRLFGVFGTHGLVDVLNGTVTLDEALQTSPVDRVRVLPAGEWSVAELPDLFGSTAMTQLFSSLKRDADVVLVDAPPPVPFAETRALASMVDGVVLVLAAGGSPRGVETDTKRMLERAHARMLGTVVNKVSPESDDSYYYHEKYSSPEPAQKTPAVSLTTIGILLLVLLGVALVGFGLFKLTPVVAGLAVRVARAMGNWLAHTTPAAISALSGGVRTIVPLVGDGIAAAVTAVEHGIVSAISAIAQALAWVWQGIQTAGSAIGQGLAAGAAAVWHGVVGAISAIAQSFAWIWQGIQTAGSAIGQGLAASATAVGHGVQGALSAVQRGIQAVISTVGSGIRAIFGWVSHDMQTLIAAALRAIPIPGR